MVLPRWIRLRASSPRLFFVVGHPRSGTNWVCNLLNLHRDIACQGEFQFHEVARCLEKISRHPWQACHASEVREAMMREFRGLVETTVVTAGRKRNPAATIFGDRTPRHLEPIVPGARHIVCVRDARDVLVSWTFHLLTHDGGDYLARGGAEMRNLKLEFDADRSLFDRSPERLLASEEWVRFCAGEWNQRAVSDARMMERMQADPTLGTATWVHYEKVHAETEAERRRLYCFLGAVPDRALPLRNDPTAAPGYTEHNPASFFRSGSVGNWRRYFTPEQERWFWEEAQGGMEAMGYERGVAGAATPGPGPCIAATR